MNKKISLLAGALFTSLSSFAAEVYQVETSFYSNNELIASPVMIVEASQAAAVSIGDNFSYELVVLPNEDKTVAVQTTINMAGDRLTPSFIVEYGQQAGLEINDKKVSILVTKSNN